LKGHNGKVIGVSVFPDGSKVVSVASDRSLKIWDLDMGDTIASFSADSTLLTCTVASDNTTIIAGDILGCVHFLRLEDMDGVKEE
jgi:WD40 repeat protein